VAGLLCFSFLSPQARQDTIFRPLYEVADEIGTATGLVNHPIKSNERMLAIYRAESCNMAIAALIQANGDYEANKLWAKSRNNQERFELIRPFLSFAPSLFEDFQIDGFEIGLDEELFPLVKVDLFEGRSRLSY